MSLAIDRTLPEELLSRIVSLTDRNILLNLCLTSKTFNRIATEYLYSNIFLKETDHLPALAYLIFTSPSHATLVKSLIIPDTWAKYDGKFAGWLLRRPKDPELAGVLRAKCAEYASDDKEAHEIYGKIESGASEDAILALLLANLPELRKLNINFGFCTDHEDFVAVWPIVTNGMRTAATNMLQAYSSTPLSVPLDIMVTGTDVKYPHNSAFLAMFVHLPNVRRIYAWKVGDQDGDLNPETDPFGKLKPRSCPVDYIELRCSKLCMENLSYLLDATIPGKLKTFNYEVGCTWAWCNTEHPKIMESLQPHRNTLETLGLNHEDFYPYQFGNESDKPYPCSFVSFTALKRLKVAPVYIWGHEGFVGKAGLENPRTKEMLWKALPENLEELWIPRAVHQEFDENEAAVEFVPRCLLPALELVIQNKFQSFPKLERLRIELPPLKWKDEWLEGLGSLCSTTAANGIQSTIILGDLFDRYGRLTAELPWGWDEDIDWEPVGDSINRECPKVWIVAAEHQDLGEVLKDIKARFEKETQKLKNASIQVNVPELARWVEQRAHMKSYWKEWENPPNVAT